MGAEVELVWKNSERNLGLPIHGLCSYMAMFPPALPNYFIKEYSEEGDVVLDPFSGRGTTALEACRLNRIGIGNDVSPLAYLLTKAKVNIPPKKYLMKRLSGLKSGYKRSKFTVTGVSKNIRMLFHPETLRQLYYLKKKLKWENDDVDTFIMATLAGILHGKHSTNLSLSMPNTFSYSPNYIRKYVKEHNLERPKRNTFDLLKDRIEYLHQETPAKGKALCKDARSLNSLKKNSVDLVITSPPYTNVIRYGQYNWIRLWLLNEDGRGVDEKSMITQSLTRYAEFMKDSLKEVRRILKPNKLAVVVIGDVKTKDGERFNLAEYVWENCAEPLGFKLAHPIIVDKISDDRKVSKIWGESKKGDATKIDRIIIMKK